jgi:hypothetical protein
MSASSALMRLFLSDFEGMFMGLLLDYVKL